MRFVAAFRFLTVIPLPIRREATAEEMGRSVFYFPVVGLIIGLILAGLYWALGRLLPDTVVNVLLLASTVLLNGALHLDGFIDTCDGLAGNKTAEERWRVMRDSRVGAFGVVGAVLLILGKYVTLSSVPDRLMWGTLLLMPVISRWAMAYAITAFPYARPSGLGTVFTKQASLRTGAAATAFTVAAAVGIAALAGISYPYVAAAVIVVAVWLVTVAWGRYLKWKFAGLTGDSYGAINEVAEIGVLMVVAALAHRGWLGL